MADQHASLHDPIFIINGGAGLPAHFPDGGGGCVKIVRRPGAQPAGPGGIMLQVRQVHIDDPVQHPDCIDRFISGGVPYQRKGRAPDPERFQDLRNKRRSGDQGDGMDTEIRQALHRVGQFLRGKDPAGIAVGYFPVLAVNAPQGASGKKDSAGSVPAGNRRLLPQVWGNPADHHLIAQTAESGGQRTIRAA